MNKFSKSKFYNEMMNAQLEREVELVYKKGINHYYPDIPIHNPFGSDGFIETSLDGKKLMLLMELKYEENFKNKANQSKVLIQALYYIKKFEENGKILPNVIMVGDKNEVFVLHNNQLIKYLNEDIDWSIAPSKAGISNPELILKMTEDDSISPFVFDIDEDFSFKTVVDTINNLAQNIQRLVRITENNISTIYDYFITRVLKNFTEFEANDLVSIFINMMINEDGSYIHPRKKNTLVLSDKREVQIDTHAYKSFFNYFERDYSPKEKVKFTEIADRLIEDTNRRSKGEFYTPTAWVDKAHLMITESVGENWKDEYVVWDAAWGTGNLTRDYNFKNLYCSTLNATDLEIGERYNKQATKFQYDFLNDDVNLFEESTMLELEYKIPKKLLQAIQEKKKILFLINPPYGTAGNAKAKNVKSKDGAVLTKLNSLMKDHKVGASAQQLYAQFLYRILLFKRKFDLEDVKVAIFSPSLFLSGPSFKGFRKEFLKDFSFLDGMLFRADHFADVKASWAVDFSIWGSGESKSKSKFNHKIVDISETGEVVEVGTKLLYNLDEEQGLSQWIKEKKAENTKELITMKSALKTGDVVKEVNEDALGFLINDANNVYASVQGVYLMGGKVTRHLKTTTILKENFEECMVLFAARNLITSTWINQKDEFMAPIVEHPAYDKFKSDSIIYSIFQSANNVCSFRNISSQDKRFDIFNEWFFMSNKEILDLANENHNDEIYSDGMSYNKERFVHNYLSNVELSHEGQMVLNHAREIIINNFNLRKLFNMSYPEYQVNNWDISWYQMKAILKEYNPEALQAFNKTFKVLEEKLREQVYDLGFLR